MKLPNIDITLTRGECLHTVGRSVNWHNHLESDYAVTSRGRVGSVLQ